jgi:MFS family permease
LLEVPSGYLADVIGRKMTLVLAAVFFPLGLALYAFTGSFLTFVLAEACIAVANSMRSGSDSALMYDTLIVLRREADYKIFEGRSFLFTRIGTAAASVIGGLLAVRSLHLPFYVNVASYALMLPIALTLTEPPRKKRESPNPFRDIVRISVRCFQHPRLRLLMLMGALVQSASVVGVWAYFLYFRSLGISVGVVGVLFAVFQLASAFGSTRAHGLSLRIGEKRSLLLLLLIAGVFIGLGALPAKLMIVLILPAPLLWGFGWPVFMDSFNRLTSSEVRATVLSVAAMASSVSFIILSPLFGKLVDKFSLSAALIALGAFYLAAGSVILALLFRTRSSEVIS